MTDRKSKEIVNRETPGLGRGERVLRISSQQASNFKKTVISKLSIH